MCFLFYTIIIGFEFYDQLRYLLKHALLILLVICVGFSWSKANSSQYYLSTAYRHLVEFCMWNNTSHFRHTVARYSAQHTGVVFSQCWRHIEWCSGSFARSVLNIPRWGSVEVFCLFLLQCVSVFNSFKGRNFRGSAWPRNLCISRE